MAAAGHSPPPAPLKLETRTYTFSVEGTRPILELLISGGAEGAGTPPEKLTFEVHSPLSGEIFEAKTRNGRIEVDRDGRVVYFSRGPESVGFTLFLGRTLVVTMSKEGSKVRIETPSKILKMAREQKGGAGGPGNQATSDAIILELE